MRGEHASFWEGKGRAVGPPPRAWRARPGTAAAAARRPDHLHVRGEHHAAANRPARYDGPPPRAWRARCFRWSSCPPGADHLHVRGEHPTSLSSTILPSGPPPRAWRARLPIAIRMHTPRTTSTCVESTLFHASTQRHVPDHLHVRGEHSTAKQPPRSRSGPPPRAWRAHPGGRLGVGPGRTTSTCVESTRSARHLPSPLSDHLHVRGEHTTASCPACRRGGPPPRAWRARRRPPRRCRRVRTTSTCVESTPEPASEVEGSADHLHVRGEHPS